MVKRGKQGGGQWEPGRHGKRKYERDVPDLGPLSLSPQASKSLRHNRSSTELGNDRAHIYSTQKWKKRVLSAHTEHVHEGLQDEKLLLKPQQYHT